MAITISGNGIVEANLADNAVTLAKMAGGTDGEILTYDASGNPVAVSVGTDGQVLTSTGAGSPPAFETAAGGGKVLQVVQGTSVGNGSTSSTSFVNTGLSASITPSATTSKILIMSSMTIAGSSTGSGHVSIYRGSTNLGGSYGFGGFQDAGAVSMTGLNYLDSPSTTSSTTYYIKFRSRTGTSIEYGKWTPCMETVILIEIGA
jgi:hypothetical protein